MSESLTVKFELESNNFDRAGTASSKIKKMLQQIGVPNDVIRRIAIGTYEGEINVIIHSEGGFVEAEFFTDHTEIRIIDVGPGIPNLELALQEGYSTASTYAREMGFGAGMGLPNMRRCSDDFAITSEIGKGTSIIMKFKHKQ